MHVLSVVYAISPTDTCSCNKCSILYVSDVFKSNFCNVGSFSVFLCLRLFTLQKNSPLTRVWLIEKFLRRKALYADTFWNMFYINIDVQCILAKSIYHTHLPADTDSVHS